MNKSMYRWILPALAALLTLPAVAESIYKWTDENGQLVFSDTPRDGAEEVEIAPVQTFEAPKISSSSDTRTGGDAAEDDAEAGYESIAISSPTMEETIWNTGGKVTVTMSVQPQLQQGHRIRLYMDGKMKGDLPRPQPVILAGVERGSHELFVRVTDSKGQTIIESDTVTFFYQQTSVQRVTPQPRPRPR